MRVWALTNWLAGAVNDFETEELCPVAPPTPLLSSAPKAPAKAALPTTALTEPAVELRVLVVQLEKFPVSKPSAKILPLTGVAVTVGVGVKLLVGVLLGVADGIADGELAGVIVMVGDGVLVAVSVGVLVAGLVGGSDIG